MEVKRVDREYLIALSVAFEGKIFSLLLVIQMMHTNPPLNRSNLVISWHIVRTIINLLIIEDNSYQAKGKEYA